MAVVVCDVVTTDWEEVEAFVAIVAMLCETWLRLLSAVVSNVPICVCRSWSCCIESEYPGISTAGIPANISCSLSACDEVSPPPKNLSSQSVTGCFISDGSFSHAGVTTPTMRPSLSPPDDPHSSHRFCRSAPAVSSVVLRLSIFGASTSPRKGIFDTILSIQFSANSAPQCPADAATRPSHSTMLSLRFPNTTPALYANCPTRAPASSTALRTPDFHSNQTTIPPSTRPPRTATAAPRIVSPPAAVVSPRPPARRPASPSAPSAAVRGPRSQVRPATAPATAKIPRPARRPYAITSFSGPGSLSHASTISPAIPSRYSNAGAHRSPISIASIENSR